ncbi:MAG TPA: helix-turn-helix domain-containing protein [Gemmatimonadaceae bacterium]|nr:helix-turn-helix domain-containing protein [Gemmatimonadaceae bacterium]
MSLCLGPRPGPPTSSAPSTGASRVNHVKCASAPALAPFVEHYWLSRWDRRGHPPRTAASLLDPCFHLHVQDGRADVMGVVRGTFRVRIEDVGCVVGVKFRPGGFYPFVERSAVEWTDRVVPADDVLDDAHAPNAWARELSDAAADCQGDAAANAALIATHLDAFLGARLPARDAAAEKVAALVALIAARADVRRIGDLVAASGRSERTLDRLFARYVGVSPAWVIRRYRLRAAAERLAASPPADVRAVAWELGYADQAHFIRDFRATIGVTPGAYVHARA